MPLKWSKEYLDIRWEKHEKDWDTMGVIFGDEGVGKSNLAQHWLDYWCVKLKGECTAEDIKHICMTGKDFVNDLSDMEKNEMTIFDEAGELDSRRSMSNFNVLLTQAYKVIRSDRLFTILVLPEFWDLEPRFRNRRVKFLIHVYARGKFALWMKDKVRKICDLNAARIVKTPYVVKPDFYSNFPIYTGVLSDPYKGLKQKKTKEARENLKKMTSGEPAIPKSLIKKSMVLALKKKGFKNIEIASIVGYTDGRISQILSEDQT